MNSLCMKTNRPLNPMSISDTPLEDLPPLGDEEFMDDDDDDDDDDDTSTSSQNSKDSQKSKK